MTDSLALEKLRSLHESGQLKASLLAALPLLLAPLGNFTHYLDAVEGGTTLSPVAIYDIDTGKWYVRTGVFEVDGQRFGTSDLHHRPITVSASVPASVLLLGNEQPPRSCLIVELGAITSDDLTTGDGNTLAARMDYNDWMDAECENITLWFDDELASLIEPPSAVSLPTSTPAEPFTESPDTEVLGRITNRMSEWMYGDATANKTLVAIADIIGLK